MASPQKLLYGPFAQGTEQNPDDKKLEEQFQKSERMGHYSSHQTANASARITA